MIRSMALLAGGFYFEYMFLIEIITIAALEIMYSFHIDLIKISTCAEQFRNILTSAKVTDTD